MNEHPPVFLLQFGLRQPGNSIVVDETLRYILLDQVELCFVENPVPLVLAYGVEVLDIRVRQFLDAVQVGADKPNQDSAVCFQFYLFFSRPLKRLEWFFLFFFSQFIILLSDFGYWRRK